MKPHTFLVAVVAVSFLAVGGCSKRADPDKVPVGTDVQLTRQDGGLVEGTLAARDEKTVTVKAGRTARTVPRAEIADFRVVPAGSPLAPPPVAKFREYTVAAGTPLKLTLETSVSSETSHAGDAIDAKLADAVRVNDVEVLPEGSIVHGTVAEAQSAGKVKGRASLALHFDAIEINEDRYPVSAGFSAEAASTKKKDAATIGIPAGVGAIIGGIVGGGKGAAAGAAIGGGGGTAVVLMTEGKPVAFNAGTSMMVTLAKAVDVRVPIK